MKPSWQVTKFTLACGVRLEDSYRSLLPANREARSPYPSWVSPPKVDRVTVLIVPFTPADGKAPGLVASRPQVPWFGDELYPR